MGLLYWTVFCSFVTQSLYSTFKVLENWKKHFLEWMINILNLTGEIITSLLLCRACSGTVNACFNRLNLRHYFLCHYLRIINDLRSVVLSPPQKLPPVFQKKIKKIYEREGEALSFPFSPAS